MRAYAKISQDGALIELVQMKDEPEGVRVYENGLPALVPFIQESAPVCPPTHKLVGPIDQLAGSGIVTKMIRRWDVEQLSAEEIAAREGAAAMLDPLLIGIVRELLDRVRALEGKAPMTNEQYKAWLVERAKRSGATGVHHVTT